MCPTFYFDLFIRNAFYHPICHMLYIVMSTRYVFLFILYILCFILYCPFGVLFPIRCVICICSCPPLICSFFMSYVLHCVVHADCFLHPICYQLYIVMFTRNVFFYPVCPMFYSALSIRIAFLHPICHMLYFVISTCDVFYLVQSERVPPSCVSYVLYYHIHLPYVLLFHVICFQIVMFLP
jgi:hypothetical protein